MADIKFLGIKQATKALYDSTSKEDKLGYLWLVREIVDNEVVGSLKIYFGTRLYAETNEGSADAVIEKLNDTFGGLVDKNGDFVGFPMDNTGDTENHPILTQDADNLLDILKNIEGAIVSNADDITEIEDKVADVESAVTENTLEIEKLKNTVSGVWHFKGQKTSVEELPTDAENGDVYQVGEEEYAWNGEEWVKLGFTLDLSEYAKNEDVEALGKAIDEAVSSLTEDIEAVEDKADNAIAATDSLKDTLIDAGIMDETGNTIDVKAWLVELQGKQTASVETMEEAEVLATVDNLGQIIYITKEGPLDESGNTTYDAGAYIVTGEGSVAKLGTTTATGDVEGAVTQLQGEVANIKANHIVTGDDVEE